MNAIAQISAAPTMGPKLDNRRVLAAIVDLLIVGIGGAVVLFAGDSLSGDRQGALGAVIAGWALYYYFALESGDGQTVGKKLMKLRVVRADGRPAGMREIAVRTVLRVVDGIGVYIVGLIVMLVTGQRRQRIGDLAAGTIVVDASGPATVAAPPEAAQPEAEDEELEVDADEADHGADDPAASTRTITLPSRPEPPTEVVETEPMVADEAPVVEVEPIEEEDAPAVEVEPVAQEAPAVEVVPVPVADEPAGEDLPPFMSPSLEGLAADVAAAQESDHESDRGEEEPADQAPEDDGPVNVKSVETVSAMDLIMGAAEDDAAEQDDDEGPVSA